MTISWSIVIVSLDYPDLRGVIRQGGGIVTTAGIGRKKNTERNTFGRKISAKETAEYLGPVGITWIILVSLSTNQSFFFQRGLRIITGHRPIGLVYIFFYRP